MSTTNVFGKETFRLKTFGIREIGRISVYDVRHHYDRSSSWDIVTTWKKNGRKTAFSVLGDVCEIDIQIVVSSVTSRLKNGTLGYKRRASLIQHSRYFSSLKSAIVTGRSELPNTRSSSSFTFSWIAQNKSNHRYQIRERNQTDC